MTPTIQPETGSLPSHFFRNPILDRCGPPIDCATSARGSKPPIGARATRRTRSMQHPPPPPPNPSTHSSSASHSPQFLSGDEDGVSGDMPGRVPGRERACCVGRKCVRRIPLGICPHMSYLLASPLLGVGQLCLFILLEAIPGVRARSPSGPVVTQTPLSASQSLGRTASSQTSGKGRMALRFLSTILS
jgi:hypothetical protein